MIRINLLPVRAAKKKESVRFQLTVAGLATILVVIIVMGVYLTVRSEANALKDGIRAGNDEIGELKKKIGELSRIKEQKRIVEEKLSIVRNLEAGRTGPTRLFQMIAGAMPEKAWLSSIKDEGFVITLKGFAATDEVVADFMRGLEKHRELGAVELEVAQRGVERETSAELVNFTIRLEKQRPADKEKK